MVLLSKQDMTEYQRLWRENHMEFLARWYETLYTMQTSDNQDKYRHLMDRLHEINRECQKLNQEAGLP